MKSLHKRLNRWLALSLLLALYPEQAPAEKLAISGIELWQTSNPTISKNRGDEGNAIDGDITTSSYLTPGGNDDPSTFGLDLGGTTTVDHLRVAKFGDIDGNGSAPGFGTFDTMDLRILYTTDSGPLNSRAYSPVSNLTNGVHASELIMSRDGVNSAAATVGREFHNYDSGLAVDDHGWYSLTFDDVQATGIAVEFAKNLENSTNFTHYRSYEIQLHDVYEQPEYDQIINVDINATTGENYNDASPVESAPIWNHVANGNDNPSNLIDSLSNTATGVSLSMSGANGRNDTTWSDNNLLEDYLFRDSNGVANVLIDGLRDGALYDIYVYTGVEGGLYTIDGETLAAAYESTGETNNTTYNPGPPFDAWIEGENHVIFKGVTSSGGQILLTYTGTSTLPGNFAGLTIAQVVPEPGAVTLWMLGGVLLLAGISICRKQVK
ncbi:MAG: hypothetical protein WD030_11740 [Pirellulales bacterium]